MIKAKDGVVKVEGNGRELLSEWVGITISIYNLLKGAVGPTKANRVLVESLMVAVNEASKEDKENENKTT